MILAFLSAEVDSPRYGRSIQTSLERLNLTRTKLIDNADVTNATENQIRIDLLKAYRGYSANRALFLGFPRDVQWRRAEIGLDELERFKYGKFKDWVRLSRGTRTVGNGARNIDQIRTGEDLKVNVKAVVKRINNGRRFPELIVVQAGGDDPVLIEGHTRATAYVLAQLPQSVDLLVGSSSQLEKWHWY